MEQITISEKKAAALERVLESVSKGLECEIEIHDGAVVVLNGSAYSEYNAKNVLQAFGMGFSMSSAYKLLDENYFFKYINLKDILRSGDEIQRIKARIIGREGKTKNYIEEVSGGVLAVYGNTIGIIGTVEELEIATSALQVLVEGGTHKKAYRIMETVRRKSRE